MKKLPYIEHDRLEDTLFSDLRPQELHLYKDAFSSLRYASRIWLSLALPRYRKLGQMPIIPNRNPFVHDIFLSLVDAYDGLKDAESEKLKDTIEGRAEISYPKRLMDWFKIF